jgi:transcriptional regulator with XRE-family HTH domain
MELGDKIKSALVQKGMTQRELAEMAGLTERTIQRIENQEVDPSVYSLNKISKILEVNFIYEKPRLAKRSNQITYILYMALLLLILCLPFRGNEQGVYCLWADFTLIPITLITISLASIGFYIYKNRRQQIKNS